MHGFSPGRKYRLRQRGFRVRLVGIGSVGGSVVNTSDWARHLAGKDRAERIWRIALLLSLLLGYFGVDRFYLGYMGLGI